MVNQIINDEETITNRGYELLEDAFGQELVEVLHRDDVIEVYCNSNIENVWIEYAGKGRELSDIKLDAIKRLAIIKIVASFCKTIADKDNPVLTAELPKYGYRFEASLPEISIMPSFNIRKPALVVFSLKDYVSQGIMTEKQKLVIEKAVRKKLNIVIAGGTGSGKTTLSNAVLEEVAKTGDRLVIIEDTRELNCTADDYESLRTSFTVNARMLIRTSMRRRPDRIIVGEVRDGAAYDLLKAWNTGHPGGVSTTHANSAVEAFRRLESLALEAGGDGVSSPPIDVIRDLIGSTVGLVLFITRLAVNKDGKIYRTRLVKNLVMVEGYDNITKQYIVENDIDKILTKMEAYDV